MFSDLRLGPRSCAANSSTSSSVTSRSLSSSGCLGHLFKNCAIIDQTTFDLPQTLLLANYTECNFKLPPIGHLVFGKVSNHVSPANSIGTVLLHICTWPHIPVLDNPAPGADGSYWLTSVGLTVLRHARLRLSALGRTIF